MNLRFWQLFRSADDTNMCVSAVPVHGIDDLNVDHWAPSILGLAGTQPIQSGLPPKTQVAWRMIAKAFPSVPQLGAWGDRSHQARKSCHNTGRAIDVMTSDPVLHMQLVSWFLEHRAALSVTLIISRRQKWSAATGWRPVKYRGVSPHTDHVHVSIDCAG